MKKEFTVNVPDEIWIDSWKKKNTKTWTYNGPDELYVVVSNDSAVTIWSEEEITRPENYFEKVVVVDAEKQPDVAFYMKTFDAEHEYIYADEINQRHMEIVYQSKDTRLF